MTVFFFRVIPTPVSNMKCFLVCCFIFVVFFGELFETRAKMYTKCGLTQELITRNFPRTYIGNWVCLIESESQKNTAKVTNKADGTKSLGIFQINSKEWCTYNKPGGKCNINCDALIDENLVDDSQCAKKIYNELGFQAWNGWKRSCYGRSLPLPSC